MSILDDIERADNERRRLEPVAKNLQCRVADLNDQVDNLQRRRRAEWETEIVLDTSLDPDPWGYHGISLVDRLKAMGWP